MRILPGVHRYPWLGGPLSRAQAWSALATVALGAGVAALFLRYLRGGDVSPDSAYRYGFALAGTLVLLVVGAGYLVRKRWAHHGRGRLHTWMAWHISGACLGVVLIFMHAAGNFHPRTGTYALYGLIALLVSGFVGRTLDRICPRLAARAATRALNATGEERLDELEWRVSSLHRAVSAPTPTAAPPGMAVHGLPWDVAYFDLDPDVDAIPRLVSDLPTSRPPRAPSMPMPREVRRQAASLRATMGREDFYLSLVRVWRRLHLLLSLMFVALLLWHIEFALTLLWNAR